MPPSAAPMPSLAAVVSGPAAVLILGLLALMVVAAERRLADLRA